MIDFLTSDLFGIILIALLIIVSISFAAFLLTSAIHTFRVSRFFTHYGSLSGIVQEYIEAEEEYHLRTRPIFLEKAMMMTSNISYIPGRYFVILDCCVDEKQYRAIYEIPAEDYQKAPEGATIQIEGSWNAIGYELL